MEFILEKGLFIFNALSVYTHPTAVLYLHKIIISRAEYMQLFV